MNFHLLQINLFDHLFKVIIIEFDFKRAFFMKYNKFCLNELNLNINAVDSQI